MLFVGLINEKLKSKEDVGEIPFNHVVSDDIRLFAHQRALCNVPVGLFEMAPTQRPAELSKVLGPFYTCYAELFK